METQSNSVKQTNNFVIDDGNDGAQFILTDSGQIETGFSLAQGTATCGLTGKVQTFAVSLIGPNAVLGPVVYVGQVILNGKGKVSAADPPVLRVRFIRVRLPEPTQKMRTVRELYDSRPLGEAYQFQFRRRQQREGIARDRNGQRHDRLRKLTAVRRRVAQTAQSSLFGGGWPRRRCPRKSRKKPSLSIRRCRRSLSNCPGCVGVALV